MKSHPLLTPILYVCCLFFLLSYLTIATSTPRYNPVENIVVNCGSPGSLKGDDDRYWIGDKDSKFAPKEEPNYKSNTSVAQSQVSVGIVPYMTARLSYWQFTYVFPFTAGPKFVRLYFYSDVYSGFESSKDFFTVNAGSFTLLRNFSASILDQKDVYKEFCINVDENQKLNLTFIPFTSTSMNYHAFINGIEIVSIPMDLYYKPQGVIKGEEFVPVYVGKPTPIYIDYSMALEMVYRLNVGGGAIQAKEDTGMFREWSGDGEYLLSGGFVPRDPSLKPKYTKIPNYTAPDAVYQSAISMGPDRTKNMQSNLTWGLLVDTGFNYLVRLHFCEIESEIHASGTREFYIYIDYQLAEERADVLLWTDDNDTPYYKDYVVMIKNKGNDTHLLSIDLHSRLDADLIDAILNGVEVFKLSDSDNNLAIAAPLLDQQQPAGAANESKSKKTTTFIAIGSVLGLLVVLTLVCCMVLCILKKTKHYGSYHPLAKWWRWSRPDPYKRDFSRRTASPLPGELCCYFRLDEIKTATNNFNEDLIVGVGGFGNVYKGMIEQGNMMVAIKRMKQESRQGALEFMTEIKMLSQLRHVHLVSLIGYCDDEGEMILVYEYMANGTLHHHLYDTPNDPLTWKQRLQICIGAARGLHHLHTSTKHPIIHRDVKTTNILLDEKWVSKVSDFGLSKMGLDNTAISTLVKGTWGYLDPNYARRQQLTEKSDVYSFGVVMFEVLCARKALNPKLQEEQRNLASWAQKCIDKGTISKIIDPYLMNKIVPECLKVYVELAESCICDHGIQRPTMNDVMEKLEFALELQEQAEATKDIGSKVVSFRVANANGAPWYNNFYHGQVLESNSETKLSTINTGLSYPDLDFVNFSITSEDVSSCTKNSSS
ncbi:receptor-like protein kinase FERONIA [Quercus suber]|uniref:receptor-like protein kinase FERONIA n=1 Tax=Quercus suber TaxID=58331 RepID=UPI000CE1DF6E|nr:receptor-like protein kinase FERONIA [Quercus suber]POF18756.1 receptor-like protein kinase feronia [Quercus suber]